MPARTVLPSLLSAFPWHLRTPACQGRLSGLDDRPFVAFDAPDLLQPQAHTPCAATKALKML